MTGVREDAEAAVAVENNILQVKETQGQDKGEITGTVPRNLFRRTVRRLWIITISIKLLKMKFMA